MAEAYRADSCSQSQAVRVRQRHTEAHRGIQMHTEAEKERLIGRQRGGTQIEAAS